MANRMKWASDWLQKQREEHLSQLVTYHRGDAVVQVRTPIGNEAFETIVGFGLVVKDEHRSFLIIADKLVLPGVGKTTPERGDRIREKQPDDTVGVYEVMAPGGGDNHWDWVDKFQKMLAAHTKLVDTE